MSYYQPKQILQGWQEAYLEFLADPTENRTQAQFLNEWGISQSALYVWKTKNHDFVYTEADKRRSQYTAKLREAAFKALAKRLEKSDKAIEMALTITGDLENKPTTELNLQFMDPNEKREKAWEIIQKLKVKDGSPKEVLRGEGPDARTGTP